jgi:hypothetical protein
MENKSDGNIFKEVHQKIQAARDKLRRAKNEQVDARRKGAEDEAVEQGFDRPATAPVV